MASRALEQLVAGMRAGDLDFAAPPGDLRTKFDGLLATLPPPDGVAFKEGRLGQVPTLECEGFAADAGTLLYFHGGGYVAGSAAGCRSLAAGLGRAAGLRTFAIDYRLAPDAPFPAAVEDGVAAYRALLDRGTDPARIAFAGDSAGGGLALSTLLAVREAGHAPPAAALLLSPWVDLACDGRSMIAKADADPSLTPEGLRACSAHYRGGVDVRHPIASPLYGDLSGLPPLLIQVGSAEILLDDATRLAAAAGAANARVRLEIWPEMIHVWHSFAFMLPEGEQAISDAAAFLRHHLGAAAG